MLLIPLFQQGTGFEQQFTPSPSSGSATGGKILGFQGTIYKSGKCRGFVGYGDTHSGNVSPLIPNHAELRMAETRAVNRALRKAYGIALCSVEGLPPWALSPEHVSSLNISTGRFGPENPFGEQSIMRMKVRGLNQPNEKIALLEGPYLAWVLRFEPAGHAAKHCRL